MRILPKRLEQSGERWSTWRWCDIVMHGVLYLSRLGLLKTPFGTIKLHWIHRPDPDRDLHDHPWWFMSFVLCGGYTEIVSDQPSKGWLRQHTRKIRWFNYKDTETAHRIDTVKPNTLTLVITGPNKHKSWGFYNDEGKFTDWKDYEAVGEIQ